MKKQHVFLLVFLILALGISALVFRASRRDMRLRRQRAVEEWRRRGFPQNVPLLPQGPREPGRPLPPGVSPSHQDVQRTFKTIEDIQRINRLNQEAARRNQQPPKHPPKK